VAYEDILERGFLELFHKKYTLDDLSQAGSGDGLSSLKSYCKTWGF
jgi:hypothetical protein